jgi:hypothetical protein
MNFITLYRQEISLSLSLKGNLKENSTQKDVLSKQLIASKMN